MGKLTKYLKQTAVVERCVRDQNDQPLLDEYGQPKFAPKVYVRCRKEKYVQKGITGQGQFVNLSSTYYFDETADIHEGDRIDGHVVQHIEEYVLGNGSPVGYEVML